jgi:hypothetical protein
LRQADVAKPAIYASSGKAEYTGTSVRTKYRQQHAAKEGAAVAAQCAKISQFFKPIVVKENDYRVETSSHDVEFMTAAQCIAKIDAEKSASVSSNKQHGTELSHYDHLRMLALRLYFKLRLDGWGKMEASW